VWLCVAMGCVGVARSGDGAAKPVEPQAGVIRCEGDYDGHLQGVATDGRAIFWSFTKKLVKTDLAGKALVAIDVPSHHGDLCVKDGVVYVAVNLGRFNFQNRGRSFIYSYSAETLAARDVWTLDLPHGAGGMTWRGDRFYVVGGLPATHERNYVYEYTPQFEFVRRHELATGFTWMGIQTAAYERGRFYFGIYGTKGCPSGVLECPDDLGSFTRTTAAGDVGILSLNGTVYTGRTRHNAAKRNVGCLVPTPDFPGTAYVPRATGKGRCVVFYEGRGNRGWRDCGYELQENGYCPLFAVATDKASTNVVMACCAKAAQGPLPAIGVGGARRYSAGDLVRGLRRAVERDEVLALHVPGTPETVDGDACLRIALDALFAEAKRLGVDVEER